MSKKANKNIHTHTQKENKSHFCNLDVLESYAARASPVLLCFVRGALPGDQNLTDIAWARCLGCLVSWTTQRVS